MKKCTILLSVVVLLAMTTVAFATITPIVRINGNHYNQTSDGIPTVSLQMTTDETAPVDWWIICLTPTGYMWFSPYTWSWANGSAVSCQGNLVSLPQFNISTTGIDFTKAGTYTFYFGVDKKVDGKITGDSTVYFDALAVNVMPTGMQTSVTIYDNFQIIGFNLLTGNIGGFVVDGVARPIALSEIESVMEVSDRVGWTGNSVAITAFNPSGVVWISNTANSDKAQWVLKLTNGKFAWANLDEVVFAGKTFVRTADDLIQYGSYRKQTIYFANGQSYIDFGCNLTDGMVSHVNPSDISYVRWNSDATKWNVAATVWSVLQVDSSGNYYVSMTGMPKSDTGLFSVVLKNGSVVWLNIDSWLYSGATISGGMIKY